MQTKSTAHIPPIYPSISNLATFVSLPLSFSLSLPPTLPTSPPFNPLPLFTLNLLLINLPRRLPRRRRCFALTTRCLHANCARDIFIIVF